MALEPITRQEQIIAGKDLQPITRMEKFLKEYGGGGGPGGGVQPDLSQNDPNAADYVKNRTHYEEVIKVSGDTLTWDGNTEGKVIVQSEYGEQFCLVSEAVITLDDVHNGIILKIAEDEQFTIDYENILETVSDIGILACDGVYFIPTDNYKVEIYNTVFPKAGVYMLAIGIPFSITIPGYTGFISEQTIIHKLPGKFLPEGVPYVEKGFLLEETDAVEGTDPNFGKCWNIYNAPNLNLTIGETYTIIYNGVPYDCVCQAAPDDFVSDPNAVALGNFSVVGGVNTGEPFAMMVIPTYQAISSLDLTGATSVKIGIMGEVVHKLDPMYLPDVLTVTVDGSSMTANKTPNEILTAVKAGKTVLLYYAGKTCSFVSCSSNSLANFVYVNTVGETSATQSFLFVKENGDVFIV